jgi:hypothetical protein
MDSAAVYIFPMRKKMREWEVIRLRSRGEYLGVVQAPDEESAIKAAIKMFAVPSYLHTSLLVRQRA